MDDQSGFAVHTAAPIVSSIALSCVLAFAPAASADLAFGVYAGGGAWQQEVSGFATSGVDRLDLTADLGFGDKRNNYFYGALEHPVPLVPNVRLEHTSLSQSGAGTLDRNVIFNGETFSIAADLDSMIDIDQTDVLAYWGLLDTVVHLDVGLGVRFLDGFVSVRDELALASSTAEFKTPVPMVYGATRVDLPFTGMWVAGSVRGLQYQENSLIDLDARVGWSSPIGLGLEFGYRRMELDVEEIDEIDVAKVMIEGPFAALNYTF